MGDPREADYHGLSNGMLSPQLRHHQQLIEDALRVRLLSSQSSASFVPAHPFVMLHDTSSSLPVGRLPSPASSANSDVNLSADIVLPTGHCASHSNGVGDGRSAGIRAANGYYRVRAPFYSTASTTGSNNSGGGSSNGSTATQRLNDTFVDGSDVASQLFVGIVNKGCTTLAAIPALTKKFGEIRVAGTSADSELSKITKDWVIDRMLEEDDWQDARVRETYLQFKVVVDELQAHVKILNRSQTGDIALKDIRNKVVGFMCTRVEPISPADIVSTFGVPDTTKSPPNGRNYVMHGIIVRVPDDDEDEAEEEYIWGNDDERQQHVVCGEQPNGGTNCPQANGIVAPPSSPALHLTSPPIDEKTMKALLNKVPRRKQIDVVVAYFLMLQKWAGGAMLNPHGQLTQQRAVRGLMILFQEEVSPRSSSWLRGVIESVDAGNSRSLMTVLSVDTGHKFNRIPVGQATWLVPEWLEKLPPLSVRAVFPDAIADLHERKELRMDKRSYTTRMYLNTADETVMDPSQTPERLFHEQLFEQSAIWYCLLRRQQCLRMNTIHLRFFGAAFYPPTAESRNKKSIIINGEDCWATAMTTTLIPNEKEEANGGHYRFKDGDPEWGNDSEIGINI